MNVKIYADGANINDMISLYERGVAAGFTTNPSLMKQAGITNYNEFAKDVVKAIPDLSVSFEVFADDFETMKKEALKIAEFGENVMVKIPVMNAAGESSIPLIKELSLLGIKLNVTAVFTVEQVQEVVDALQPGIENIVSVFAGRIADTGVDPVPIMKESANICHKKEGVLLLWASSRELYNMIQADEVGADIITCTPSIIAKLPMLGKELLQLSQETVQMFSDDVKDLGFKIL
ncbi:transaldolase [Erysipelothrix urinaevulpis]|uniref:transaldolase n=1 Tax=Erysipelothrix urinaevulpis TaxID=2683717 RepID=UPI00135C249F|nr:transaldolase [Erysipelothrix urinaevulpis]